MEGISRRQVLRTVSVAGAVTALGTTTSPAAWSWSSTGSIAGASTSVDPSTVWDEPADQLLASLLDRGDVPALNTALRSWVKNSDALPDTVPTDVHDFIQSARQLPNWADATKLE